LAVRRYAVNVNQGIAALHSGAGDRVAAAGGRRLRPGGGPAGRIDGRAPAAPHLTARRAGWTDGARRGASVIGSVLPRGRDVGGLLRYLFREGRAGRARPGCDHTAPRLIAAWDNDLPRLEPAETAVGRRDVRALAAALSAPVRACERRPASKPVYHLAIAAAKDPATGQLLDKMLTDGQWADIAAEYVHQIGLAKRGDEQAVRWVAVRHADDHIHVVATLARQDGRRVFPRNDHYRAREASLTVEARYDLIRTSPAGRTSSRPASRAEDPQAPGHRRRPRAAGRPGPSAPDRLVLRQLVRAAAGGSSGWEDFTEQLRRSGVLLRPRMSERDPRVRSPATPSPCPAAPTAGRRSGSAAGSSPRT
jgi:hypothetical protein